MRPVGIPQSYLRYPLNELFGTPANVRLMRLLVEADAGIISAPEAAHHSGLTEAGARRALKRLAKTGFVERIGGGRSQHFRLRPGPLATQLAELFRVEERRYHSVLSRLREVFSALPEARIAWIDEDPVDVGQPLHIGVLADSPALLYLDEQLRHRIVGLERDFDMTVEIHTFSRADSPEVDWENATLLAGHVRGEPNSDLGRTHVDRVVRAAKISRAIAEMIDRDPSLLRRAEKHLDYLLTGEQGSAVHDLREWKDILNFYSRERLKDFLAAETPRAQRLRQSSPFFAALTPEERDLVLDRVTTDDA